ncbi:MAG: hypothetical protein ACLP0H_03915 [Terriglobales bacterium]
MSGAVLSGTVLSGASCAHEKVVASANATIRSPIRTVLLYRFRVAPKTRQVAGITRGRRPRPGRQKKSGRPHTWDGLVRQSPPGRRRKLS